MKFKIENIDNLHLVINIEINKGDYYKQTIKSLINYSKNNNISGFRNGFVPIEYLMKLYGKNIIKNEINRISNDLIIDYIHKNKIKIIGNPILDSDLNQYKWNFNDIFNLQYHLGIIPHIAITKHSKYELNHYNVILDDNSIDKYIEHLKIQDNKKDKIESVTVSSLIELEIYQDNDYKIVNTIYYNDIENEIVKKAFLNKKVGDIIKFNINDIFISFKKEKICALLKIKFNNVNLIEGIFLFKIKNIFNINDITINDNFYNKLFMAYQVNTKHNLKIKIKNFLFKNLILYSNNKLLYDFYSFIILNSKFNLSYSFIKKMLIINKSYNNSNNKLLKNKIYDIIHKMSINIIREHIIQFYNIKLDKNSFDDYIIKNNIDINMYKNDMLQNIYNSIIDEKIIFYIYKYNNVKNINIKYQDFIKIL